MLFILNSEKKTFSPVTYHIKETRRLLSITSCTCEAEKSSLTRIRRRVPKTINKSYALNPNPAIVTCALWRWFIVLRMHAVTRPASSSQTKLCHSHASKNSRQSGCPSWYFHEKTSFVRVILQAARYQVVGHERDTQVQAVATMRCRIKNSYSLSSASHLTGSHPATRKYLSHTFGYTQ